MYKVAVITPTIRPHMLEKCIKGFLEQDYSSEREMIIICDLGKEVTIGLPFDNLYSSVGDSVYYIDDDEDITVRVLSISRGSQKIADKLNYAISLTDADIIIRMDDDDYYAPDWISKSVQHLIDSKSDLTGLSSAYFYQPDTALYDYTYKGKQPFVLGATMCFWRKTWERSKKKFYSPDARGIAEDKYFCVDNGVLIPHNHKKGFVCMLHGANTSSQHIVKNGYAKKVDIQIAKNIINAER